MHKNFPKNTVILSGILILMLMLGSGCESNKLSKSAVNDVIDVEISDTLAAIEQKDVKMARDIWSDLSELSVSLQTTNEDLSVKVATLALSYEQLVAYCNDGEQTHLDEFKEDFKLAAEELKAALEDAGYDCSAIEDSLQSIYE